MPVHRDGGGEGAGGGGGGWGLGGGVQLYIGDIWH